MTEISYEVTSECTYSHLLDFDSLTCHLANGHSGPHRGSAVDGDVWWQRDKARKADDDV